MALASLQLDPSATSYTDDEIVGKVNTSTVDIDGYVQTHPNSGEHPVLAIQIDATGKLDVDYDDVAVP